MTYEQKKTYGPWEEQVSVVLKEAKGVIEGTMMGGLIKGKNVFYNNPRCSHISTQATANIPNKA